MNGMRIVLAVFLCWGESAAMAMDPHPVHETVRADYRLYYDGMPVGEVTEVWERDGSNYRIHSEAHPYPVVRWFAPNFREDSVGQIVDGGLQPSRFVHERSDGQAPLVADFHWNTGELILQHDGKSDTVPLPPDAQDMLSIKYLYRVAGNGWLERDLPMVTGKHLEIHHFVVHDRLPIDTDAGRFEVQHVVDVSAQAPSRLEIWLATDLRDPPVRLRVTERGSRWEQRLLRMEIQ